MRTNFFSYSIILGQIFFISLTQQQDNREKQEIKPQIVQGWADKLGTELWELGDFFTRRADVIESFKDAKVELREGMKIVSELAKDMEDMMNSKIAAVKRIVDTAENAAVDSNPDEPVPESYEYYNAKLLRAPGTLNLTGDDPKGTRELLLTPNSHFFDFPVNTSVSSVHVPTNVYDRAQEVIYAIKWSERLEHIFKGNYKDDPNLSWQYFGSSTGFMRQFPATGWSVDPVDLYDCRTRAWYIEAATSPKDVLILVDNSGSMMGQRKEIARHVVNSILDTLGNNDFVNIMSFVNDTKQVVECYKDMLVQANLENIRELKLGMKEMGSAQYIANFSTALTTAFDILQQYRENRMGAACNQAIMLITDGVPYNYKEIFEEYNWRNLPYMPVRVFTYLLGKEVADVREVKWMACANRGYYVHLSTLAEVREQVLQYVPVMARPMVLHRTEHPVIWTSVYADITDPSMTDYLWEQEECKEQKQRSMNFRKDRQKFMEPDEQERRNIKKLRRIQDQTPGDTKKYRFMTSVSMPVFDKRDTANVKIGRDCSDHDPTCPKPTKMKVAYLLGVAGTDIPIEEINSILKPHWLGVNAYAFIVTNNGYILVHPDWRPVFQGILKPNYNAIDMTDVELMDDGRDPLDFHEKLLEFRRKLVRGNTTGSISLPMKQHLDNLRRVMRGTRYYYYKPIVDESPGKSPLTLVVSLPEHYGRYQVEGTVETHLLKQSKGKINYFEGNNWRVHPDWYYCKYREDSDEYPKFKSPEEEVEHFFAKSQWAGWSWPTRYPERQSNASSAQKPEKPPNKKPYFCDRNLFLSLVFDAKVTSWFNKNVSAASAEDKGKKFKQRFGLQLVFLATRSGLTRWQDIPGVPGQDDLPSGPHFKDVHIRAIDEVWYRRAVEQNYDDPEKFIYTVPFNSGILGSENLSKNEILVTASNAIFIQNGEKKAPAAVVGFQFQHSALYNLFMNITHSCPTSIGDGCRHSETCASDNFECFVLDSSAYVILSENKEHTGYFFGEIHADIMEQLVAENIYRRVHIYDYQGVCFVTQPDKSDSSCLKNPLHYLSWLGNWIVANVLWFLFEFNLQWIGTLGYSFPPEVVSDEEDFSTEGEEGEEEEDIEPTMSIPSGESNIKDVFGKVMINRTRPAPCTMEVDLYQLVSERERVNWERERGRASRGQPKERDPCRPPFVVQSIRSSDMILLVVKAGCPPQSSVYSLNVIPSEYNYNSTTLNCQKIKFKHNMDRRRPPSCIKEHEKEEDIKLCGRGGTLVASNLMEWLCLIALYLVSRMFKSS